MANNSKDLIWTVQLFRYLLALFQCLMVQKDGTLYLKDIQTGNRVCQLALPNPHQLESPWEPIVSFGGRGQLLYVKGESVVREAKWRNSTCQVPLFIVSIVQHLEAFHRTVLVKSHLLHPLTS